MRAGREPMPRKPSRPKSRGPMIRPGVEGRVEEPSFAEVLELIQKAQWRSLSLVNTALIDLYWQVGAYISRKLETAAWGEGVVDDLASYIYRHNPNLRGFTRRNLFRMRQFFEAYREQEKVSALLSQLPWTHHLMILSRSKCTEEREFYISLAVRERWSSRELERQLAGALFERTILSPPRVSRALLDLHPDSEEVFRDAYVFEFLGLPEDHREAPSIGVLLCAGKDDEVVEYALSRAQSPALIAEYQTHLPDKKLLQAKLRELYALTVNDPQG
jgi:predicted nuclease of restriction endonuclease-like (RecB) superfamily